MKKRQALWLMVVGAFLPAIGVGQTQQVIDSLSGYGNTPAIRVNCTYEAEAGKDYTEYWKSYRLLKTTFSMDRIKYTVPLPEYKEHDLLAKADLAFEGNATSFREEFDPVEIKKKSPDWTFKSEALFDGSSYIYKTVPGLYASVQGDYNTPISSYYDVLTKLPAYVPESILPIGLGEKNSLKDSIKSLGKYSLEKSDSGMSIKA
jgi:hypothetical protein